MDLINLLNAVVNPEEFKKQQAKKEKNDLIFSLVIGIIVGILFLSF